MHANTWCKSILKFKIAEYVNGIQIEDICILRLNNSVPRNRFIINGKEWVLNTASKLFNNLPNNRKCTLTTRFRNIASGDIYFLCRTCLKLLEKRDRILSNLTIVENNNQGHFSTKWSSETDLASPTDLYRTQRRWGSVHTCSHITPQSTQYSSQSCSTCKSFENLKIVSECETSVKVCSCGIQHIFTLYFYHNSDKYKYMIMYLLLIILKSSLRKIYIHIFVFLTL
jgi:hypothetical protein